jgi:ATP-binding protein involved in chromosome partitioning
VPILGVVENMSYLESPNGDRQTLFGEGGGAEIAKSLETELFGQIPLDPAIREGSDRGIPIVISDPDSPAAQEFTRIARQILQKLPKN